MNNEFSRRARMDMWTPAEKAIHDAMQEVEKLPPDTRLTEAVILLGEAQRKVADFVDEANRPLQVGDKTQYGTISFINNDEIAYKENPKLYTRLSDYTAPPALI